MAIWICTFAQYQAKKNDQIDDIGPSVAEQLALDPFTKVLESGGVQQGMGLVAIHTTSADLYVRLWCPFEMKQASELLIKVQVSNLR